MGGLWWLVGGLLVGGWFEGWWVAYGVSILMIV